MTWCTSVPLRPFYRDQCYPESPAGVLSSMTNCLAVESRSGKTLKIARALAITFLLLAETCANTYAQKAGSAQEFAPGVISTGKGFTVAFLPDGKTVYVTARELNSTA